LTYNIVSDESFALNEESIGTPNEVVNLLKTKQYFFNLYKIKPRRRATQILFSAANA